jgi:hypothetical protein
MPLSLHAPPYSFSWGTATCAQFQVTQNQSQKKESGGVTNNAAGSNAGKATTDGSADATSAVQWSTADDRALKEAVGRVRTGLLFVGGKT